MNSNNEKDSLIELKRLSSNNDYYNVIFKKTERIASAVFYILANVELNDKTKRHYDSLSDRVTSLHTTVIDSLNLFEYEIKEKIYPLQQALVALLSTLRLSTSAQLITPDIEVVITDEIDMVLRYIRNHYLSDTLVRGSVGSDNKETAKVANKPRRQRVNIPQNDFSSDAFLVYSELSDRTLRIKTVLEATSEATIKDLSDIITDVSTKTLQRDINSLIKKGEVIRQGERRWSKYSIVR